MREIPDDPFPGWDPPGYRVDANGKVVGAEPGPRNNWGRFGADDLAVRVDSIFRRIPSGKRIVGNFTHGRNGTVAGVAEATEGVL